MTTEQILLETWRSLSWEKQQEVIDFVKFLHSRMESANRSLPEPLRTVGSAEGERVSNLGERLMKIREEIVGSGETLLTMEEIDREVEERRGGYQAEDQ